MFRALPALPEFDAPGTLCGSLSWQILNSKRNNAMAKKFDPAPSDKHAEDSKRAREADKKIDKDLDEGLKDSFPGSERHATRKIQA
jgi:hypothetical protein